MSQSPIDLNIPTEEEQQQQQQELANRQLLRFQDFSHEPAPGWTQRRQEAERILGLRRTGQVHYEGAGNVLYEVYTPNLPPASTPPASPATQWDDLAWVSDDDQGNLLFMDMDFTMDVAADDADDDEFSELSDADERSDDDAYSIEEWYNPGTGKMERDEDELRHQSHRDERLARALAVLTQRRIDATSHPDPEVREKSARMVLMYDTLEAAAKASLKNK